MQPSGATCRFCLEAEAEDAVDPTSASSSSGPCRNAVAAEVDDQRMVSPCACRGTSASVHLGCLRRWQNIVVNQRMTEASQTRAAVCPVCREELVVDGKALRPSVSAVVWSGRVGTLLVATENLEGEGRTFHRSVILVCQVENRGQVRGVDVTHEVEVEDSVKNAASEAASSLSVHVLRGGPVCGGRLGVVQYAVLATFREAGRNAALLEPQSSAPALFGPEPWVTLSAADAVQLSRSTARSRHTAHPEQLLFFRGHASWGRGQLESEIRCGNWATCIASAADVFETPRAELWERLWASGRLARSQ